MTRRVPLLAQVTAVDCGPACLAMVLSYYGCATDPKECREWCAGGRDGVTARAIALAALARGFRVQAFSLAAAAFGRVPLPAIVHWNGNHFVVVERWSAEGAEIVDPGTGRRRLTAEEFAAGFSGVALSSKPDGRLQMPAPKKRSCEREYVAGMLREPGTWPSIFRILGASLLLQLLGLATPAFTKVLVDGVLPSGNVGLLERACAGMFVLVLGLGVASYVRARLLIGLEARLDSRMMHRFFEHLLGLPLAYFQQRTTGDLVARLGSITIIRETFTSQAVEAALDGALVMAYLAVLFVIQPVFGAVALGLGAAQVMLLAGIAPRMYSLMQRELAAAAHQQSYVVEAIGGIATLRASGAEERALEHWSHLFFRHLSLSLKRNRLSAAAGAVLAVLRGGAPAVLLWLGAIYTLEGRITLGTMLALNTLALSVLSPLASFVSACQQILMARSHLDRIADVLKEVPEQDAQAFDAPTLSGGIDVKHLRFRYSQNSPLVLDDIHLQIRPGEKVAIVGQTASGKSTLARVLLGFYKSCGGQILYDGVPLEHIGYRALRRQFGVVLQEPFLFSGTIRENIAFHNPGMPAADVIEASRIAGLHEEIIRMPMGYDTFLPEGGTSLSGGQRQRLALARALAHHPAILLLDEATSHLDAETERLLEKRLGELSCTRIVIAHRLSTVRDADMILVLRDGRIVERGPHNELMELEGYYASLVRSQFVNHREAPRPAIRNFPARNGF